MELDGKTNLRPEWKGAVHCQGKYGAMIRLVENLMRLTSEEAHEMDEEVPLNEVFAMTLDELSPMIQKKNLTVTIKNTPDISLTGSRIMLTAS